MFKRTSILVALLIVFMVSGANAATDLFSVTASDGQEVLIDSLGKVLGLKQTVEAATTNDTVTAAESGKVFAITPTSFTTITLPTAASGLTYTFVQEAGHGDGSLDIALDPASTDKFVGCVNSGATDGMAVGDKLRSPGATGDSVTIVGASTKWYCTQRTGTWVDDN